MAINTSHEQTAYYSPKTGSSMPLFTVTMRSGRTVTEKDAGIAASYPGDRGTVERDVNRDGLTDDAAVVFGAVAACCSAWRLAARSFSKSRRERSYSSTRSDHLLFPGELWHLGYSSALQPLSPRRRRSRPSTVHASDEHGSAVDGDGCSRGHWLLHRVHVGERDVVGFAYTPDWQLRCKTRVHGGFLVLGHRSP
jgi:hypothetical protein